MDQKNIIKGLIKRIIIMSLVFAAVIAAASLFLKSPKFALSVGMGWLMSATSFAVLCITAYSAFMKNHAMSFAAAFIGIAKLAVLGLALWFLITKGYADPLAFMAGFGATVIALIFEGFRMKAHGSSA